MKHMIRIVGKGWVTIREEHFDNFLHNHKQNVIHEGCWNPRFKGQYTVITEKVTYQLKKVA